MKRPLDARTLVAAGALVAALAAPATAQDPGNDDSLDLTEFITPTCELAGLRALPPEGWFNASVRSPPPGHRGCQMMRTNEADELVGMIRLRSLDAAAPEFAAEGYDAFVSDEMAVLASMGFVLGEPIWARDDVPVAGSGFSAARAVGLQVTVEEGPPHEIHLLVFRSAQVKYLLVLTTPSRTHDEALYQTNEDGFARLITTLQQPVG